MEKVDGSCEVCDSPRNASWIYMGVPMCWVCRWLRRFAPAWLLPLVNYLDSSGQLDAPFSEVVLKLWKDSKALKK